MTRSFVALGSNLANPLAQVSQAISAIAGLDLTHLLRHSPWYQSRAIGPGDQPDYINGVAEIETSLDPFELLNQLQKIEMAHQRTRQQRWAARTLDLDILTFGGETIVSETLEVPHPGMKQRSFVLHPLHDIAPDLTLPCGTPIASLLAPCPAGELRQLDGIHSQTAGERSESG